MKFAIIGAGAMGGLIGGYLAKSGNEVVLIDVWRDAMDSVSTKGLRIDNQHGAPEVIHLRAQTDASDVGQVDVVIILVKCTDTDAAVRSAHLLLGPDTIVISLQNGWGSVPSIAGIIGEERVLAGVTYHSATVVGPGHLLHTGSGTTIIGELDGTISHRLEKLGEAFRGAGLEVSLSEDITKDIWSKLLLAACTLPTCALLGFLSGALVEHDGTIQLVRRLLRESITVAGAQGIEFDEAECWEAITAAEKYYSGAKGSMLQDIEKRRRTEIDVINGAIVAAGKRLDIPTPYNETMVWLVKSLEETF